MCKIYLWNHLKLAEDFKNKKVSEAQRLVYFIIQKLVYFIIGSVSMVLVICLCLNRGKEHLISGLSDSCSFILLSTIALLIILIIIFKTYKENKKGDGLDYVIRYLCLELPVGIKTAVFGVSISLATVIIYTIFNYEQMNSGAFPIAIIIFVLIVSYLVYYKMMMESIRIASSNKTANKISDNKQKVNKKVSRKVSK